MVSSLDQEIKDFEKHLKDEKERIDKEVRKYERTILVYSVLGRFFLIFGFIILVIAVFVHFHTVMPENLKLNELGDVIGGTVATLWSASGLFFIYIAFLGQQKQSLFQQLELKYSQLEVKYTRRELHGQKAEMKEQNKTLSQQRFDNTFFNLLENHRGIVNEIDIEGEFDVNHVGHDAFEYIYGQFRGSCINQNVHLHEEIDKTISIFKYEYDRNNSDLAHYFRNLYHVIKFIDKSEIENKKDYTNLVRAQLSNYELLMIFYNCLTPLGSEKSKPLIEKYALLKHIPMDRLIRVEDYKEYDDDAFGGEDNLFQKPVD